MRLQLVSLYTVLRVMETVKLLVVWGGGAKASLVSTSGSKPQIELSRSLQIVTELRPGGIYSEQTTSPTQGYELSVLLSRENLQLVN